MHHSRLHRKFCQQLRKAREDQKMTPLELANKMKVNRSYIYDLERGRYSPSLDLVQRLANALDMNVEIRFKKKRGGK